MSDTALQARKVKAIGFTDTDAVALATQISTWLADAGEKKLVAILHFQRGNAAEDGTLEPSTAEAVLYYQEG